MTQQEAKETFIREFAGLEVSSTLAALLIILYARGVLTLEDIQNAKQLARETPYLL